MKICHISTVHNVKDVRVFYRECQSLVKVGYEVSLIIRASRRDCLDGINIIPLPNLRNRFLRMTILPWIAMVKALKTKAAIYHYHDPELILIGFILRWLCQKHVVFDIHESIPRQLLSKPYLPLWSRRPIAIFYTIAEHLLSFGQSIVVANENSLIDYPRNSYLVRNYPIIPDTPPTLYKNRFNNHSPLLTYVGGVAEIRGAYLYVQVANILRQKGYNFKMMIIGPYTSHLYEKLHNYISVNGLDKYVSLTGRMDWPQAMEYVSQATIGLCLLMPIPNYTTCLATKIIEYMMLGTPVLASNFKAWEIYVNGENIGLSANPLNIDDVVTKCEQMLNNPDMLYDMGQRGIKAVFNKYNWQIEFKNMLRCYNDFFIGNA